MIGLRQGRIVITQPFRSPETEICVSGERQGFDVSSAERVRLNGLLTTALVRVPALHADIAASFAPRFYPNNTKAASPCVRIRGVFVRPPDRQRAHSRPR